VKKHIVALLFSFCSFQLMPNVSSAGADPFIGEIQWFAGNFAPRGWAFCDGQLLPINQNQALFSILGTTYGGDGRTTFALPDLRSRAPLHRGQGPGLSNRNLGSKGGTETVTLSVAQMPAHTHTAKAKNATGTENVPNDRSLANIRRGYSTDAADVAMDESTVGSAGGGQPVNNMQPYLGLNCIIALQGLYPSRN